MTTIAITPASRTPHTLHGVFFMLAAVACFAALDTSTKLVTQVAPLLVAIWFRYAFQAVITLLTLAPRQGRRLWATQRPWMHVARGLLLVSTSALAYLSLQRVSLADFTAIVMLSPIVMSVVAAWRARRNPGLLAWLCVVGGFAGVLVVMRPGGDLFGWAALLPLGLVATNSAYQLVTSDLGQTDDLGTMHLYSGLIGALLPGLALPWAWQPLHEPRTWALLVAMGVLSSAGHLLLGRAYQKAPVVQLTPFLYMQIVFAVIAGWIVFGHVPDAWSLTGMAMIGVSGACSAWFRASAR